MNTHSLCVVIVDDEKIVAKTISLCLRRSGCALHSTTNPKLAMALIRQTQPDVILCDAGMPGMSGPELIENLKANPTTEHIPVVLMTGVAEAHMFSHAQWTGFLSKPFGPAELIAALHHAVATAKNALPGNPVPSAIG